MSQTNDEFVKKMQEEQTSYGYTLGCYVSRMLGLEENDLREYLCDADNYRDTQIITDFLEHTKKLLQNPTNNKHVDYCLSKVNEIFGDIKQIKNENDLSLLINITKKLKMNCCVFYKLAIAKDDFIIIYIYEYHLSISPNNICIRLTKKNIDHITAHRFIYGDSFMYYEHTYLSQTSGDTDFKKIYRLGEKSFKDIHKHTYTYDNMFIDLFKHICDKSSILKDEIKEIDDVARKYVIQNVDFKELCADLKNVMDIFYGFHSHGIKRLFNLGANISNQSLELPAVGSNLFRYHYYFNNDEYVCDI